MIKSLLPSFKKRKKQEPRFRPSLDGSIDGSALLEDRFMTAGFTRATPFATPFRGAGPLLGLTAGATSTANAVAPVNSAFIDPSYISAIAAAYNSSNVMLPFGGVMQSGTMSFVESLVLDSPSGTVTQVEFLQSHAHTEYLHHSPGGFTPPGLPTPNGVVVNWSGAGTNNAQLNYVPDVNTTRTIVDFDIQFVSPNPDGRNFAIAQMALTSNLLVVRLNMPPGADPDTSAQYQNGVPGLLVEVPPNAVNLTVIVDNQTNLSGSGFIAVGGANAAIPVGQEFRDPTFGSTVLGDYGPSVLHVNYELIGGPVGFFVNYGDNFGSGIAGGVNPSETVSNSPTFDWAFTVASSDF